jgi:hypothetical protein
MLPELRPPFDQARSTLPARAVPWLRRSTRHPSLAGPMLIVHRDTLSRGPIHSRSTACVDSGDSWCIGARVAIGSHPHDLVGTRRHRVQRPIAIKRWTLVDVKSLDERFDLRMWIEVRGRRQERLSRSLVGALPFEDGARVGARH